MLSPFAMLRKKSMDELERLPAAEFRETEKFRIVLILDEVRSMHNVGSVFRSADAFCAQEIALCGYTPRPPHRDIQKTALGATETVAWQHFPSAVEAIAHYRDKGFRIIAVEQVHGSISLPQYQPTPGEAIALVLGNEVDGVSDAALAQCDGAVEIPQFGSKHSLNLSVSAGIVLYALTAGRGAGF